MYVTYTFNPTTSTRYLNSVALLLPPIFTPGATATTDGNEQQFELNIQEPGTITLRQSGALIWYSQTTNVSPRIKFGAQSERTYTDTALAYCGASFFTHRVDSGGAQGAGVTLTRGINQFEYGISMATLGVTPSAFGGFLFLNYESDVSTLGPGAHNQSLLFGVQDSQASGTQSITTAAQEIFQPSTEWYRSNLGFLTNQVTLAVITTGGSIQFEVESAAGELTEGGWENQGVLVLNGDGENGWYPAGTNARLQSPNDWQRWTSDPETSRLSLTASRRWRIITSQTGTRPLSVWTTMHNINYTVSSTISGSSGGTVTVNLHRASDGERLKSTSRTGNGTVSVTWYDNTEDVYLEARETDALVGRSGNGTATGSP